MSPREQEELVALREQMAVPDYDEARQERTRIDGVEWVVFWDRNNRWGLPQVVAIHHGALNLMDHLTEPPAWANAAMTAGVREEALDALEMAL